MSSEAPSAIVNPINDGHTEVKDSTMQPPVTETSSSPSPAPSSPIPTPTPSTPSNYTRHNAPQRSKVKPRWHTQPYMMFLALRSLPNRTGARQEIISAAVELDRKFSAERGLPRVFTGKTPMNSASACLTNNGDKYFIPFKPEGSRSTHFRLAYQPGDFDTAVAEYDKWMEKLIKHDWPLCFGVPKEGAVPIHILEKQEQERKRALEAAQVSSETDTNTTTTTTALTSNTEKDAIEFAADTEASSDLTTQRKRIPEQIEDDDEVLQSIKKQKVDTDVSQEADKGVVGTLIQDTMVEEKMERLDLKPDPTPSISGSTASAPSTPEAANASAPSTPEATTSLTAVTTATASSTTSSSTTTRPRPRSNTKTSASSRATSVEAEKEKDKEKEKEKVDEYRLEDLDLSNVPTSLSDVVRVDVSTIPNSGNGLFAKIDLPASTPLGFYFGVPMTENEFDSLKDGVGVASHYSIMYRRTVLDATDEKGMPYSDPSGRLYCPFHFMNEDPNGNITFITGSVVNQVICTTNRDIKAGEELFVFYGKEVDRFWAQNQEGAAGREGDQTKSGQRSRTGSPARETSASGRPRRSTAQMPARV
ncbi:hypothetical protein BGZ94_004920 [Podila epigama]|nr:hypothetical protein BGZ94_004920 [Podila epigama]